MNKKLQVFISSTYNDLIEERAEALKSVLIAGHIPIGMEFFYSSSKPPIETIKRHILESDVVLLILGGKYGSINKQLNKSFTEFEYEFARENNVEVLAIILSDNYLEFKIANSKLSDVIEGENSNRFKSFQDEVKDNATVSLVDNISQISLAVTSSLYNIEKEALGGWIKNPQHFFSIGRKHHLNKEYDEAIKNYKMAIDIFPEYISAIKELGGVYYETYEMKKPKANGRLLKNL